MSSVRLIFQNRSIIIKSIWNLNKFSAWQLSFMGLKPSSFLNRLSDLASQESLSCQVNSRALPRLKPRSSITVSLSTLASAAGCTRRTHTSRMSQTTLPISRRASDGPCRLLSRVTRSTMAKSTIRSTITMPRSMIDTQEWHPCPRNLGIHNGGTVTQSQTTLPGPRSTKWTATRRNIAQMFHKVSLMLLLSLRENTQISTMATTATIKNIMCTSVTTRTSITKINLKKKLRRLTQWLSANKPNPHNKSQTSSTPSTLTPLSLTILNWTMPGPKTCTKTLMRDCTTWIRRNSNE